jgi:hypothetical protein
MSGVEFSGASKKQSTVPHLSLPNFHCVFIVLLNLSDRSAELQNANIVSSQMDVGFSR